MSSANKPRSDSRTPVIGVGTLNISDRGRQLVMEALRNNRLSYGPMTEKFEKSFAETHGCRFGVMSNSGTSALQLALQAMKEMHGWQDGDEVVVPALTFIATSNIVLHNRMRPVLADVDPAYYGLDPKSFESKLSSRTRAVIPVHLFGHPADMKPLLEIASSKGLKTIEDSCETMFVSYNGRKVGSLGDIGCFSTYVAHLLVTGVGGLNTTNDSEYAVRLRSLMNHGRDSIYLSIDDDNDKTSDEMKMIIARRFKFVSVGHSFRVTEMESALGLAQLEGWKPMIAQRQANAAALTRGLSRFTDRIQLPSVRPGSEHAFMMYPIVLREGNKQDLVNFLEQHGVETRDMLPLTNQPVYGRLLGTREADYPVAEWVNRCGFYVGCHQDIRPIDLEYIIELFERFWRQKRKPLSQGAALVLRTRNSAAYLERTLEDLPVELFDQILAYDEGSTDGTKDILAKRGIKAVDTQGRDSLRFLAEEDSLGQENVVLYPVDGRHDVRDIAGLLLMLERNHDMVIASRFIPGGERRYQEGPSRFRSIGNRIFNLLTNLVFFSNVTDCLSDFRAFKASKLRGLGSIGGKGLPVYYRCSIRAVKKGWRTGEMPTVEFVTKDSHNWRRISLSLFPLMRALISEMFFRR